jgi:hypothetical protein
VLERSRAAHEKDRPELFAAVAAVAEARKGQRVGEGREEEGWGLHSAGE